MEELKEIEKFSLTATLLQKHVSTLSEQHNTPRKTCSNLKHLVECKEQYSIKMTSIPCEKYETLEKVLDKARELENESRADIPDSSIDKCAVLDTKRQKMVVIVKFTTLRFCTLLFRARKKLKNGVTLHVDLSKKRYKFLLDTQRWWGSICLCWYQL